MSATKRILSSATVQAFLCWIGAMYVRLVFITTRWTVLGGDIPKGFWERGESCILSFWHGRILMVPCLWNPELPSNFIVSKHRDGQIINRIVSQFGIKPIPGSTGRGGSNALRKIVRALKRGESVGIAPDGPRGPLMRMGEGIVTMARLSGAPVVPLAFAANPRFMVNSWDRFVIPWPFARGVIIWGDPIPVPPDADAEAREAARIEIENRITEITAEADRLVGVETPEPAPIKAGDTAQ
ncbi:MAG: lysophospholipid acyltransferase family protein [Rhodospirillales bacterium]|nr:lysophospholipid acyltransferase family protein [Rhodospirillales bacterium]